LAGGLRGTDQYWYAADAEALGRHFSLHSNNVFPATLFSPGAVLPPYFKHDILSVWLAAVPTFFVGPAWGWLLLNLAATAGTALLIGATARRVASSVAAQLCALAYIVMPLTLWQTAQPLAETAITFFAALALYFLAGAGRSLARWMLVTLALGGLYFSRQSYLPVLLLSTPAFLLLCLGPEPRAWRRALWQGLVLGVTTIALYGLAHVMFSHENVSHSYMRLLYTNVPGMSDNMSMNFDMSSVNLHDTLHLDPNILLLKLAHNLEEQVFLFANPMEAFFYWSFNMLTLIALWMLWRCRRRPEERLLLLAALVPVGVHLLTIVLFQNQFRYLLPAFPGLLIALAIALTEWDPLRRRLELRAVPVMAVVLLVSLLPNIALGALLHREMAVERQIRGQATALFDRYVPPDDRMIIAYHKGYLMFGYAARPRLVLFVDPTYDSATFGRLRERFTAGWLFAPAGSPFAAMLGAKPLAAAAPIEAFGTPWQLYSLPPAAAG
jgi:4-amino-4-deoxy-L-arabinose transferase-like glycosyltransferase